MEKARIGSGMHYPRAIPDHDFYRGIVSMPKNFLNAKLWAERELSLPIYPGLTYPEVEVISNTVNSVV